MSRKNPLRHASRILVTKVIILGMKTERKPNPTDVNDAEWAFVAPYLTLMKEDAPQRDYSLKRGFQRLVVDGPSRSPLEDDPS